MFDAKILGEFPEKIYEETSGIIHRKSKSGIPGEISGRILERVSEEIPGEISKRIPGWIHEKIAD